jgi:hypothetical protein
MSWKTSPGIPARLASSLIAMAVSGVNSDGFRTTVHPAAKAGANLRVTMAIGKFLFDDVRRIIFEVLCEYIFRTFHRTCCNLTAFVLLTTELS